MCELEKVHQCLIVGPSILTIKFYLKCLNFRDNFQITAYQRYYYSEQIILLLVFEQGVELNHAAHFSASLEFQTFQIANADPSNSTWKYFVTSKGTPKQYGPYEKSKKTFKKKYGFIVSQQTLSGHTNVNRFPFQIICTCGGYFLLFVTL